MRNQDENTIERENRGQAVGGRNSNYTSNKDPNKWIWIIGAFILGTAFGAFLMSL